MNLKLVIPLEFAEDGKVGRLEGIAVTSFQRPSHQVAKVDISRRNVRSQRQFEFRLDIRVAFKRADDVHRPSPGVDQFRLRRTPFVKIIKIK